jgi:hypothetical protein
LLIVQFKRLLNNRLFYISLFLGSIITVLHYLQITMNIYGNQLSIPDSAYLLWLNSNSRLSDITKLFFILLPILAVLPFSIQLLIDKKTNYYQLIMIKSGKYKYLLSMLTISSIGGFLVIAIPISINFLLFSITFPYITPDPFIYYTDGLSSYKTLFFYLQLNYPLIHTLIYILLSGIVGSIFALFAAVLCLYLRFSLIILVTPLFINLLMSFLGEFFGVSLSPIYFLEMSSELPVYLWSVLVYCSFMIICTIILFIIGVRRLEK